MKMTPLCLFASFCALTHAVMAFAEGEIGYGLGLLGATGAWLVLSGRIDN